MDLIRVMKITGIVLYFVIVVIVLLFSYFPVSKYPDSPGLSHIVDPDLVLVELIFSAIVILLSTAGLVFIRGNKLVMVGHVVFIIFAIIRAFQLAPLYQY